MDTLHAFITDLSDELTSDVLERAAKRSGFPPERGPLPATEADTRRFFDGLARVLSEPGPDTLKPDALKPDALKKEALSALACDEAHAFATRGLPISSGLALLKCYRASLVSLVGHLADESLATEHPEASPLAQIFDLLELALIDAWVALHEEEEVQPLHRELDRRTGDLARCKRIISGLPLPVFSLDSEQRTEHLNQAAIAFLRDAAIVNESAGDAPARVLSGHGDLPWIAKEIEAFSASDAPYTAFKHAFPTADGERTLQVRLHRQDSPSQFDASGRDAGVVVVLRESSATRSESGEFHRLAFYDELTGLPSRALLLDRLSIEIPRSIRSGRIVIVGVLQIDAFDEVLAAEGLENVGVILEELSVRLQATVRRSDSLSRLTGGTFAALLPDAVRRQDTEVVATELLEAFDEPFVIEKRPLMLTASLGVSLCPDDATTPDELLALATSAMEAARETGGDGWVQARQLRDEG